MLENKLLELGFSQREARIYLALLEIGESTVSKIAKASQINRTTIYDIIPNLVREGYVKIIAGDKVNTYKAETPDKIPLILDKKIQALKEQSLNSQKLVSQLQTIASKQPGKPTISFFEGKEGIRSLYDDTLLSKGTIQSFGSTEVMEKYDREFLNNYYRRRADKKIFINAIVGDVESACNYQKKDKVLYRKIRIVPQKMMNINPEVYIYDNKVAFFSFAEKFAVLIESNDIAEALRNLYGLAWDKAKDLDK